MRHENRATQIMRPAARRNDYIICSKSPIELLRYIEVLRTVWVRRPSES